MNAAKVFVLGGTGFIGMELVREASAKAVEVLALACSDEKAERLLGLGARPVRGDMNDCEAWIDAARGCDVVVDLTQPPLPARIGLGDIQAVAAIRVGATQRLVAALEGLPASERPLLFCASGTDDLEPDARGRVDGTSPLRSRPTGFGHVGVAVRSAVEASGVSATFLYLGTVYGPGKSFAATVFPRLARGRLALPAPAENQWPLIHVRDAARAIVHLARLGRERLLGRSLLLVDAAGGARLGEFFDHAAALMGVPPPRRLPAWILALLMGRALLDTLRRDLRTQPSDLLETGFRFTYPTISEGLPPTLEALGYALGGAPRPTPQPPRRRVWPARLVLAAAVAGLVGVNVPDTPLTRPGLESLADGQRVLDLRFGYGPEAAHGFLVALGAIGRERYLQMLWTVDLVLPFLFGLCLWTMISRGSLRRWRWLGLLAAAADYCENMSLSFLLGRFPEPIDGIAVLASALTVIKFLLYFGSLGVAAVGAGIRRTRVVASHGESLGR